MDAERSGTASESEISATRRQALKRLGFATAVAYAAPTILHLDRSAKAQILPSCINPPGVPPNPGCQGPNPANFSQPADGPVLDGSSGGGQ
jgi:hypothetical protein